MTTISLFTPVDYARPKTAAEGVLSALSNYFYLGGPRATVVENDNVRLEPGTVSWIVIALKVASYILLFPLTLPLLAIDLVLRHKHNFIVITTPAPATSHTAGNATALEFISCINPTLFTALAPLTLAEAQEFVRRGGALNIVTPEKTNTNPITMRKQEQVITGCNSGINRSQVAAAAVTQMGINVVGVLAGGDSAMNPEADFPTFSNPLEIGEDVNQAATNFAHYFGMPKRAQIGATAPECQGISPNAVQRAKAFYQNYINQLAPTHFITFGPSGPSVIRRLLQRQQESLRGFTITHLPWGDTIAHPPQSAKLQPYSVDAYALFATEFRHCFQTI
jgi:hypothetical protein